MNARDATGETGGQAVEVWTMPTPPAGGALADWQALLDPDERAQAARFVFEANRQEYVAAHALTRLLLTALAARAGGRTVAPGAWRFDRAPGVKPRLVGPDVGVPLAFNLSHTGGRVAVAGAAAALDLGVDVEAADRRVDPELAARYFTPGERAWLDGQRADARPHAFLRLWTLKEAYLKAHGGGLTAGLDSIAFDVDGPVPRAVAGVPDSESWWFRQWTRLGADDVPDHVLALACRGAGGPPEVAVRDLASWQCPSPAA